VISTSKSLSIVLVCFLAISCASLLMVKSAHAQTTFKPAIPNFSLRFYPAFSNVTSNFRVENNSICVIVTNQNFSSYFELNTNSTIAIYYGVQAKEHNSTKWVNVYGDANKYPYYPIQWDNSSQTILPILPEQIITNYSSGSQIDVQVQAILGNITWVYGAKTLPLPSGWIGEPSSQQPVWQTLTDSGWSSTQTVTIGKTSNIPEFPALAVLPLLLIVLLVGLAVIVSYRKVKCG